VPHERVYFPFLLVSFSDNCCFLYSKFYSLDLSKEQWCYPAEGSPCRTMRVTQETSGMIDSVLSVYRRKHFTFYNDIFVPFLSLFIASGVGLSPLYCGHFWPIIPAPDDWWGWLWSNWWNEDWQRKPKYSEKTCPSATLSTTNPTWPDPGSNPGRRDGKPATNRLSYGAASQLT
jgi:hypothetical protein